MLKLPVDWAAIKVPALFSPVLSSLTSRKNPEIDPLGDVFRLLYLVSLVGLLY
jgi:hypothetical protein